MVVAPAVIASAAAAVRRVFFNMGILLGSKFGLFDASSCFEY
jgi:hypothetical protein